MSNIISDNAVIIIAVFLAFAILLFRKELRERLSKLDFPADFLGKVDDLFTISTDVLSDLILIESVLSDGKLTPDEIKTLLVRFGTRKKQLEELIK